MTEEQTVTMTGAAAVLKRHRATVKKALAGVACDAGPGRYQVATVRAAVEAHDARVAAMRATQTHAAGGRESTAGGDATAAAGNADQAAFRKERAQWMLQKRIAIERENARRAGELIPVADAIEGYSHLVSAAKVRLLAVPNKVAARVKMCATIPEVAALLTHEIHMALEELSRPESYGLSAGGPAE